MLLLSEAQRFGIRELCYPASKYEKITVTKFSHWIMKYQLLTTTEDDKIQSKTKGVLF